MPTVIILGTQWGDEGKGKATDQLGQNTDYVVKFNGGDNVGHTVVIDGEKYAPHLSPVGILPEGVTPIIGDGVIVDIKVMFQEIDEMASRNVDCSRLKVSSNTHITPSYNRLMNQVNEQAYGKDQTGTAGRRIGPIYADKMNRIGIRVQDLFDPRNLAGKVKAVLASKDKIFAAVGMEVLNPEVVTKEFLAYVNRIRPVMRGVSLEINEALDRGDTVLFEGGQAAMLDINHGTYPPVTSSNPTVGGALTGAGVGSARIDWVIGIAKVYMIRVGEGPFPTELDDEVGEVLCIKDREFGATTGYTRGTDWFDAVVVCYAARINRFADICLTKPGVLSGYPLIPVYFVYEIDDVRTEEMPLDQAGLTKAVPVYEELPGWDEGISGRRTFEELPANAQMYIARLEGLSKCRTQSVGVGPDHETATVRYPLI